MKGVGQIDPPEKTTLLLGLNNIYHIEATFQLIHMLV